jgi:hypothetical protein
MAANQFSPRFKQGEQNPLIRSKQRFGSEFLANDFQLAEENYQTGNINNGNRIHFSTMKKEREVSNTNLFTALRMSKYRNAQSSAKK